MSKATISFPIFGENFKINVSDSFELFGRSFYYYGLIITLGFILAAIYIFKRRKSYGLTSDNTVDIMLWAVILGIVGARLFYVVFEDFSTYLKDPIEIIKIWNGGLAIYGGVIFGALGIFIYSRIKKINFGSMLDLVAPAVLLAQAVGRWGNFFNREVYGIETTVPWKMGLTTASGTMYVHPLFFYEFIWNLVGFGVLHFLSKKFRKFDGQICATYLAWYGLGRFFLEAIRNESDILYFFGTGIKISQLMAAVTFIAAIIFLVIKFRKKPDPQLLYVNTTAGIENLALEDKPKGEKTKKTTADSKDETDADTDEDDTAPEDDDDDDEDWEELYDAPEETEPEPDAADEITETGEDSGE